MGDNLNGIFANMIQGMGFIGCAPNRVYNMAPPNGGGVEAAAEGTELTLHSAAAPLTALTIYGKSEQETTTGAQLFDAGKNQLSYYAGDSLGLTTTYDPETGWFHVTGTLTGGVPTFWREENLFNMNGGVQYYFSVETAGKNDYIALAESHVGNAFSAKNISATQQVDINANQIYANNSYEVGTEFDLKFRIMISIGSTALPWEQYTGGAPSPSPDYPQEIKSAGDSGTINVSLSDGGSQSQILPVQTPNGLPGIPVSSGGNYTDADGQQWICDEVDFERGVYVQRVHVINAKNSSWNDGWNLVFPDETGKTHVFNVSTEKYAIRQHAMSNVFFNRDIANSANVNVFTTEQGNGGIGVRVYSQLASTLEEWNAYINSHDVIFALALKEQNYVETPLSASELAAYAALRTYSPTTVVSNDAGAWMRVGYKATPQPMTMLARKR